MTLLEVYPKKNGGLKGLILGKKCTTIMVLLPYCVGDCQQSFLIYALKLRESTTEFVVVNRTLYPETETN